MALPQGSFNVEIYPANNAYKDTVISNVSVLANQSTDIGSVELQNN